MITNTATAATILLLRHCGDILPLLLLLLHPFLPFLIIDLLLPHRIRIQCHIVIYFHLSGNDRCKWVPRKKDWPRVRQSPSPACGCRTRSPILLSIFDRHQIMQMSCRVNKRAVRGSATNRQVDRRLPNPHPFIISRLIHRIFTDDVTTWKIHYKINQLKVTRKGSATQAHSRVAEPRPG